MNIINFDPGTITNAGGVLVTADQAKAALAIGSEYVAINPSVAIVLVDPTDGNAYANVPLAKPGSVANSPFVCAAATVTMVKHRGGAIKAISTGADSTVKWSFAVAP